MTEREGEREKEREREGGGIKKTREGTQRRGQENSYYKR